MRIPFPDGNYSWGSSDGKFHCSLQIRAGKIVTTSLAPILQPSLLFALTSGETSMTPQAAPYFLEKVA